MIRMMLAALLASMMLTGGCRPKNSVPDMPKPKMVVELIEMPEDLQDTPGDAEWSLLVEHFNAVVGGLNRVAANVEEMGENATPEMKSGVSEATTRFNDIRQKVIAARSGGASAALRGEIDAAAAKVDEVRSMLIQ